MLGQEQQTTKVKSLALNASPKVPSPTLQTDAKSTYSDTNPCMDGSAACKDRAANEWM